ncbi:MAG: hypothetical protein QHH14_02025 [Clostridiales bacterium]|nr:hypothetical protein [Clostridiales bacterium]
MVWWVFALAVLSILSYLSDVGILSLHAIRVPGLNASLISVLILLSAAGLLSRILWMKKKGRREELEEKVRELESRLASLIAEKK